MDLTKLKVQLKRHEGLRLFPYEDSVGKLTIGIGRNLEDIGITEDEADFMLQNDITRAVNKAKSFTFWPDLDSVRQMVVAEMIFNLGVGGFSGFKNTIRALQIGNYQEASVQMLDSKWATQVGIRARRLARQMRTGEYEWE